MPLPAPPPPPPLTAPQPPTFFNRDIEADEYLNEAAFRLYTKFIDELAEFVDQQGEVIKLRLAVQEKRQELQRLRENVSQCDMVFVNQARQYMIREASAGDETLVLLFEAAQAARDQVGPIEVEYEPLEIELGYQENRLKQQYEKIEARFEHFFRLNATSTTRQSIPSIIEYESSSEVTESRADDIHPDQMGLERSNAITGLLHGTHVGERVVIG
jgi:hypothetical protein